MKRVTLTHIAKQAQVHVTTVSMVLRDHPRISEKTKQRVRAIANEMGYVPDPALKALSSYRQRSQSPKYQSTIAYLTNWTTEWGWKDATGHLGFYAGAHKAAKELGYKLEHFWLGASDLSESRLSEILQSRGIQGLVLASHGRERGDLINLDWSKFSTVKIDYFPHDPLVHNITNDQSGIIRLAMRQAIRYGYKRIGFVMHRGWNLAVDQNWMAGFLCEAQAIPKQDRIPALIFPGETPVSNWLGETVSVEIDPNDFQKWFQDYQPDVIITNHLFVQSALQQLSIRSPEDVALIDLFLADTSGVVAGVFQNHETVGELAVEFTARQISHYKRGVPHTVTTTFVEGTWYDGQTCPVIKNEMR